jgi:hypothetical protein
MNNENGFWNTNEPTGDKEFQCRNQMKQVNLKKYFNDNTGNALWLKNKKDYKSWFRLALSILKLCIDNDGLATGKQYDQSIYRNVLGYMGIGRQGGFISSISTTATRNKKGHECTDDHLFGATEIGNYIHQEFEHYNLDIDYMVDVWLSKNLWLWLTIKVTTKEHKKENIQRNMHKVEDKLLFKHYKNVSLLMDRKTGMLL